MNVRMLLSRTIRTIAILACLVMATSFVLFAIDKASGASDQAQTEVNASGAQAVGPAVHRAGEGQVRRAIDDADRTLAAPFAVLEPAGRGAWGTRGVDLLGGLLLYGFGLGALARATALTRLHPHGSPPDGWAGARF